MQTQKLGKRPRPLVKKVVRFLAGLVGVTIIASGVYGSYLYADYLQLERNSAELPGLHLYPMQESHSTQAYSWYTSYPKLGEPVFDRAVSKTVNDAKAAFLARVNFQATTKFPLDDLNMSFEIGKYDTRTLSVRIVKFQSLKGVNTNSQTTIMYDRVAKRIVSVQTEERVKQGVTTNSVIGKERAQQAVNCKVEKCVALTFNDGPNPMTSRLLDTLKTYKVKATFFEIGDQARLYPTVAKRTLAEGHVIGTLGENHRNLLAVPMSDALADLSRGTEDIKNASGARPVVARASYKAMTSELAKGLEMPFVGWDVGEENELSSSQAIYRNVMSKVHDDAIVMSHDTQTVANAYARIVPDLIKQGYRLVTVPQLKGDLEPGLYDSN